MISEKIAIIDDDQRVIKSLKVFFNKYQIVDFTDPLKAIEFFQKPRDIGLLLIDVMMPKTDGINVLKQIRKHNKEIYVIIITGYGTMDVAVEALRNGANDFLEKPLNLKNLKDKLHSVLKERAPYNKNSLKSNYKIERIKNFVKRNYTSISLENIAEEMCLSSKHISRMFKEKSGMTYRDYKIKLKMDKAKFLLANSTLSIDQISYNLGYKSPETFMRYFKHKNKITPGQYRKESLKRNLC